MSMKYWRRWRPISRRSWKNWESQMAKVPESIWNRCKTTRSVISIIFTRNTLLYSPLISIWNLRSEGRKVEILGIKKRVLILMVASISTLLQMKNCNVTRSIEISFQNASIFITKCCSIVLMTVYSSSVPMVRKVRPRHGVGRVENSNQRKTLPWRKYLRSPSTIYSGWQ